ncbi:MAG: MMPL family transporter [Gammaproteobacteria bacterium]
MRRRAVSIFIWLSLLAAGAGVVARAHFAADMTAFLPSRPSAAQQILVDELRDGVVSRVILMAIDGSDPEARAQMSQDLTTRLHANPLFLAVANGRELAVTGQKSFVFEHRYLLSSEVGAALFTVPGLRSAIADTLDIMASSAGLFPEELLLSDPTGETVRIIDQLTPVGGPRYRAGVWSTADGTGALLIAQTRATGSDVDGQEQAIRVIRAEFDTLRGASPPATPRDLDLDLKISGPGVLAVRSRATIEGEAIRLSVLSALLIAALLLLAYRSLRTLLLGFLPVISGALAGTAAVALTFGVVHGVTLAFGVILIAESVDYSIYLLTQVRRGRRTDEFGEWASTIWPTVRLGLLTSLCGFASLLPSGFPGLAQLGLYTMTGLLAAALVTRYVLPDLLPGGWTAQPIAALGTVVERGISHLQRYRQLLWIVPVIAAATLFARWDTLWNSDLAALSPISAGDQLLDARLRSGLGASGMGDLVVIRAPDDQAALRAAESVAVGLEALVRANEIGGFDSPARYLPSLELQRSRQAALPSAVVLQNRLRAAVATLPIQADRLEPFVAAVESARASPLVTRSDLDGTLLAAGVDALLMQREHHAVALLPLRPAAGGPISAAIDAVRVAAALGALPPDVQAMVVNMKHESDAIYAGYQSQAISLSLLGFGAIVLLLLITLRSPIRVARVVTPLMFSVLVVMALLAASGRALTILHLVGLLLIVAVGSNYSLFFETRLANSAAAHRTTVLASLVIANLAAVLGFGVLALSPAPVLAALGMTIAPGAFMALLFSALMAAPQRGERGS